MPVLLSSLVVLIAALGGWLLSILFTRILFRPYLPKDIFGLRVHGVIPATLPPAIHEFIGALEKEFLAKDKIAARLRHPDLMLQLKPEIEQHVDEFLQTKLKEIFPLLSGLMGEKTLGRFKTAFLLEIETILPDLLTNYSNKLMEQWKPLELIQDKITSLPMENIEKLVLLKAAKQLRTFQLAAALAGACLGAIQVLIIHLYS